MMTQNKRYLIAWEKYKSPFGDDDDDEPDYEPKTPSKGYDDGYSEEEGFPFLQTDQMHHNMMKKPIKLLSTPMGMIPLNEQTLSSKIFNFWTGHTNFNITADIHNIIEQTEGVETLDVFTRYRLRVGVGKAFDDGVVLREINSNVAKFLNHKSKKKITDYKIFNINKKNV